ncbi:MAG: serine/threonine-protein kinase [Myxococcota bacterium]
MDGPGDQDDAIAPAAWTADDLIGRRYVLERQLGSGSTGDVWLAQDQLLSKAVALKVLQPELAKNRDTVRRFLREVALAHAVTHPHVVRIYDTGEERGLPYFTMEYVKGQTLEERIDGSEDPMGFKEIRRIAFNVLDGLEAAHAVGVIHRDLKPGNVMLTHRGAIVMDFGVAGIEDAPSGVPDASTVQALVRTEAGTIFGSPAYMAPELWEGAGASVQSDLFAFGVMLYQMLTGHLPYTAKTPADYVQQLTSGPPPSIRALRRDTPWPLLRVVGRCMSAAPAQRPASAAAAINLLNPLRSTRRRRIAVAAVGAVAGIGAATWWQTPWEMRARGLPDATAQMDLDAAVRMFDAGDDAAALRVLDRVATRAPHSAAVTFWRATVHASLGDGPGRAAACAREGARAGSAAWRRWAEQACDERFTVDADADPLRPLWVDTALLPAVEAERDPQGPAHQQARDVLAALETPDDVLLPHRRRRARVDLEIALGRVEEAQLHLTDLVDAHPHAPLFTARAAWLASVMGHRDRARALAERVRPVDPTPALRIAMDDGRMAAAWTAIDDLGAHPRAEGLRALWCAIAWRHGVSSTPPQCSDLPMGFAADLWANEAPARVRDPLEQALLDAQADLSRGTCPAPDSPSTVLTHAGGGFETGRAQLDLRAALCRLEAGDATAIATAREQAARLLAATPTDPWALRLAADVDDASDDPASAHAHRLAAAQRWRDADADLPGVARLRARLAPRPPGPRSASAE